MIFKNAMTEQNYHLEKSCATKLFGMQTSKTVIMRKSNSLKYSLEELNDNFWKMFLKKNLNKKLKIH